MDDSIGSYVNVVVVFLAECGGLEIEIYYQCKMRIERSEGIYSFMVVLLLGLLRGSQGSFFFT